MKWLMKMFGMSPTHESTKIAQVVHSNVSSPKPKHSGIPATVSIVQAGTFDFEVVGESQYQQVLRSIVGPQVAEGHSHVVNVWLVCEDSNPHDRNAVAVTVDGKRVGYLPKADARDYRIALRELTGSVPSAQTKGMIVGGGLKKRTGESMHLGIRIDLEIPPDLE